MKPHSLQQVPGNSLPGGHYSHAVIANGVIYVSGQLPISSTGEKLGHLPFEQQAQQALANVFNVLKACDAGLRDIVQIRVYIDDINHWNHFNEIYSQWIGEWKPARAIIPVPPLHYGLKIEIEAVAAVPASLQGH